MTLNILGRQSLSIIENIVSNVVKGDVTDQATKHLVEVTQKNLAQNNHYVSDLIKTISVNKSKAITEMEQGYSLLENTAKSWERSDQTLNTLRHIDARQGLERQGKSLVYKTPDIENFGLAAPLGESVRSQSNTAGIYSSLHSKLNHLNIYSEQQLKASNAYIDGVFDAAEKKFGSVIDDERMIQVLRNPNLTDLTPVEKEAKNFLSNYFDFAQTKIKEVFEDRGLKGASKFGLENYSPDMILGKWTIVTTNAKGVKQKLQGFESMADAREGIKEYVAKNPQLKGKIQIEVGGLGNALDFEPGLRRKVNQSMGKNKLYLDLDYNTVVGGEYRAANGRVTPLKADDLLSGEGPAFANLLPRFGSEFPINYSKDIWKVGKIYAHRVNRFIIGEDLEKQFATTTADITKLAATTKRQDLEAASKALIKTKDMVLGRMGETRSAKIDLAISNNIQTHLKKSPDFVLNPILERMVGRPMTNLLGATKDITNFLALTLRVVPTTLNWVQPAITLWPHVGTKQFVQAYKLSLGMVDPATAKRLGVSDPKQAVKTFLNSVGVMDEANFGSLIGETSTLGLKKLQRATPFSKASQFNRRLGYLTGRLQAMSEGLDNAAQHLRGNQFMAKTEFISSVSDVQPALRDPFWNTVFQYKSFFGKNLENIMGIMRQVIVEPQNPQNWKALAKVTGALGAAGGTTALSPADEVAGYLINNARDFMFGAETDVQKLSRESKKNGNPGLSDVLSYGLPSLMNVNLTGNLSLNIMPFGESVEEKIGNFMISPAVSVLTGVPYALSQIPTEGLKAAAKIARRRVPFATQLATLSELASGDTAIRSSITRRKLVSDQPFAKALFGLTGIRSFKHRKAVEWMDDMYSLTQDRTKQMRKITEARAVGDWSTAGELTQDWNSIHLHWPILGPNIEQSERKRLEYENYTPAERIAKSGTDHESLYYKAALGG